MLESWNHYHVDSAIHHSYNRPSQLSRQQLLCVHDHDRNLSATPKVMERLDNVFLIMV